MASRQKLRLGDLLVEHGVITAEQLEQALAEQKRRGHKLGRTLIALGFLTEDQLLEFLSRQLRVPLVDLRHYQIDPETVRLIPEMQARRYRAIALKRRPDGRLLVGMADPTDVVAIDALTQVARMPIDVAVVREADLLRTLDTVYRHSDQIVDFAEELSDELSASDIDMAALVESADVADAPVVRLIQTLFEDAVQVGASDIHIEPDEQALRLRQRVDGVLHEQVIRRRRIAPALALRLKLMAGLDISEKRLPQDGRFSIRVREHTIDVRLATMPVAHGEAVVMRLLDQTAGLKSLDELGMPAALRERFYAIIHRPHGMVLVTGPTGSGKTTTLYAGIRELNVPERKIITVEDPVEYRLPRVNQVQVNPEIGLTFARVLRAALRHDPDIVLVGEVRDEETMEIALRAALTGHLVLSTLHTNDAVSTVSRLLDMGAAGYLLGSALDAILAQRLVRRVCDACAEPAAPDPHEHAWLVARGGEAALGGEFRRGRGCQYCNNTGYRGRIGVFELLEIDRPLADALARGDSAGFAAAAATQPGYRPLVDMALDDARRGLTTIAEAMRLSTDLGALEAPADAAAAAHAGTRPEAGGA